MKVLKVPRWLFWGWLKKKQLYQDKPVPLLTVITNRNGGLTLMQFWGKLKVKPN